MTRVEHRTLHCDCGAVREVSVGLPIVACVRCGGRMHAPRPPEPPVPSKVIVAGAAILIEVLCAVAFTLAALWMLRTADTGARAIAVTAVAGVGLLAGALAYRGSVGALIVGAAITGAIAIACLIGTSTVSALLVGARVAPQLIHDPGKLALIACGVALIAVGLCVAALPQARKFSEWRRLRIERAFAIQ